MTYGLLILSCVFLANYVQMPNELRSIWTLFFFFAITCTWGLESYALPHLILVSGHCLFPLSIESIIWSINQAPSCDILGKYTKKGHFVQSPQIYFGMGFVLVNLGARQHFLRQKSGKCSDDSKTIIYILK